MAGFVAQDVDHNGFQIKSVSVDRLSSDPSGNGLYKGRVWYNTTSDLYKGYNGTSVVTLSFTAVYPGRFVGSLDASAAAWPTSGSGVSGAIVDGDTWQVSAAGTIGAVALHVGDVVMAKQDDADADNEFAVVETERTDMSPYMRGEDQENQNFTAGTEKTITSAQLSTIRDVEIWNITGGRRKKITSGVAVEVDDSDPTICYVTIGIDLTGVTVTLIGNSIA
jgi:hypothetical protein